MRLLTKVKSSALQYTLVVSVLIAIIVFAFISLVFLQQKLQIKNDFYKQAIQNMDVAFSSINSKYIPYNQIQNYNFSGNTQEHTVVLKKHWGVFDLFSIKSTLKNETFEQIALVGTNNNKREAIYLQETNKPLVVVGNTKITGNVFLPKQGVKTGNISGVSYKNNQLIYGTQKVSSTSLPKIDKLEYINSLFQNKYTNIDNITYFELEENLNKTQKFNQPIAINITDEPIILRNISLRGNIVIQSQSIIKISNSTHLEDILLIAPKIEVEDGTTGNFQLITSKEIKIGENCRLRYPSALIVINNMQSSLSKYQKQETPIFIDKNSHIKGVIVYHQNTKKDIPNFKSQLIISENTTVTGEVFCNENLELLGSVFGSVYTKNFITKQSGSIYVNYIYNGVINSTKLPKQYCGLSIADGNTKTLKVAKWLY